MKLKPSRYGDHRAPVIINTRNLKKKIEYHNDTIWDRKNKCIGVINTHSEASVKLWFPVSGRETYLRTRDFQDSLGKRYLAW